MSPAIRKPSTAIVPGDLIALDGEWWAVLSAHLTHRCNDPFVRLCLVNFCRGTKFYEVSPSLEWNTRQPVPTAVKASVAS